MVDPPSSNGPRCPSCRTATVAVTSKDVRHHVCATCGFMVFDPETWAQVVSRYTSVSGADLADQLARSKNHRRICTGCSSPTVCVDVKGRLVDS